MNYLFIDEEVDVLERIEFEVKAINSTENVEYVQNPRLAISIIENKKIENIVTDLDMPEIDGFQVIEFARKKNPEANLFILTGLSMDTKQYNVAREFNARIIRKSMGYKKIVRDVFNHHKQDIKKELINKLKNIEDGEVWIDGQRKISVRELISEIISDTALGNEYIELYKHYKNI